MRTPKTKTRLAFCWGVFVPCILILAVSGTAPAKSLYVIADHHTAQFDAYEIKVDGTLTWQATHNLQYATDPSGMAVWVDPSASPPEGAIFITSEFSLSGVEFWDAKKMQFIGTAPGAVDQAGIDVDSLNNVVYSVQRYTNNLYVYHWDPVTQTLTPKPGYNPYTLPNCTGAFGLALDQVRDLLWIADSAAGMARAYDLTTLAEDTNLSFDPCHAPIDIAVDKTLNLVYTVSMSYGAWTPPAAGSNLLSKYDVATGTETTADLGCHGVGIAVDEVSGYVYVTVSPYCGSYPYQGEIQVWNTSTSPLWTLLQVVGVSGSPAGIAVGNVSVNPLNLAKNDTVVGHGIHIGQTFTYEITCDNNDNDFDVTNVILTDMLPVELDFVSETVDGVPNTGVHNPLTHTVTWHLGTIPAGEAGPLIELVVRVNQNGVPGTTIYNYCRIDSDQTEPTTEIGKDPDDPNGEPGTYIRPAVPLESFVIDNAEIVWIPCHRFPCENTFAISGTFELPEGYKRQDLAKVAIVSIQIAGKEGKDQVRLRGLNGSWTYTESPFAIRDDSLGQGIDIKELDINWCMPTNSFCTKHMFYIEGELLWDEIGLDTEPREATITLEIPPAPNTGLAVVIGEETIAFEKNANTWLYGSVPDDNQGGQNTTDTWDSLFDSWLDELPSFEDPVPPVNPSIPEPPQQGAPTWTAPSLDDLLGDSPMWSNPWLDGLLWPSW